MSTNGKPLRAGVIGCGDVSREGHIPALLGAGVSVVAVCDTNFDRANEVAGRFGVPRAYDSHPPLLAQSDVDLVTVAVPNAFHASVAIDALRVGKHVLCEKPMSVTSVEGEAMIAAAEASGRILSVNQHMRFDTTAVALREAVSAGALGDVYLADARMTRQNGIPGYGGWFTNRELAGRGALFDIGVHQLDLTLFVLGFPEVVSVRGFLAGRLGEQGIGRGDWGIDRQSSGRFDVDDTAVAALTLADGGHVRLHVAWAACGPAEERLTLYGSRGGADRVVGPDGPVLRRFGVEKGEIVDVAASQVSTGGWTRGIEAFVAAVRGEGTNLVPPRQTLAVTRLLERIAESALAGCELPV